MPPTGGEGGNTALRDAGLLLRHLMKITSTDDPPSIMATEIEAYEKDMLNFAWGAVSTSKRNAQVISTEGYIFPYLVRGFMRIMNLLFGARDV